MHLYLGSLRKQDNCVSGVHIRSLKMLSRKFSRIFKQSKTGKNDVLHVLLFHGTEVSQELHVLQELLWEYLKL